MKNKLSKRNEKPAFWVGAVIGRFTGVKFIEYLKLIKYVNSCPNGFVAYTLDENGNKPIFVEHTNVFFCNNSKLSNEDMNNIKAAEHSMKFLNQYK